MTWQCPVCRAEHWATWPGQKLGVTSVRDRFYIDGKRVCCLAEFARVSMIELAGDVALWHDD